MSFYKFLATAAMGAAIIVAAATAVHAQGNDTKRVRITYQNLTAGQGFAPSVFMSHNASAPKLYAMGGKASFGLAQLAETGNVGPLAVEAGKMMGRSVGKPAIGLPTMPRATGYVDVEVDRAHPMISDAWMLGMTNDGFSGISGVNAYELSGPHTMNVMAMDAGSEKNNERRPYLVALMGTRPDAEGGVVKRHAGIRGGADAPAAWKFDPAKPVARVTITPL
jgi:hypothetical protein